LWWQFERFAGGDYDDQWMTTVGDDGMKSRSGPVAKVLYRFIQNFVGASFFSNALVSYQYRQQCP